MDTKTTRNLPIRLTGKRLRVNVERREFRGRSHRKGGKRIRAMREALITE